MPLIILLGLLLFCGTNWFYTGAIVGIPFHWILDISGSVNWLFWFLVAIFIAWCFDD